MTAIGNSIFNDNRSGFGLTSDIDFGKFQLGFDYGSAELTTDKSNYDFKSDGTFFRVGPDYNFMYTDQDQSVLFFGLRYARSSFDETLDFTVNDGVWPSTDVSVATNSSKGRWFELVSGLKGRVWKELYLGFTVRYKFAQSNESNSSLANFEIPGYGKASDNDRAGFDYYIYWRIPFKKKELVE